MSAELSDRRGIAAGGQVAPVTLGYLGSESSGSASRRDSGSRAGSAQASQELRRAPQNPHNLATRRAIPTGILRTKWHTPIHLLCVLKILKIAVSSVDARELGCWRHFQVSALGMTELLKS
jgi:hypothetical protein